MKPNHCVHYFLPKKKKKTNKSAGRQAMRTNHNKNNNTQLRETYEYSKETQFFAFVCRPRDGVVVLFIIYRIRLSFIYAGKETKKNGNNLLGQQHPSTFTSSSDDDATVSSLSSSPSKTSSSSFSQPKNSRKVSNICARRCFESLIKQNKNRTNWKIAQYILFETRDTEELHWSAPHYCSLKGWRKIK